MRSTYRSGFSMVGMLITLVCMVVLFSIGLGALNQAMTGSGSAKAGTVRSMEDQIYLKALYQSMVAGAADFDDRFITPSVLGDGGDAGDDTTANLFSAMVMLQYTPPKQLISGNEYSGYVEVDDDYDYLLYDPSAGVYWDPAFDADLEFLSNTSFAHIPLFGKRFDRRWVNEFRSSYPLIGNRGPKDGIPNPDSWTYGRDGTWGGHLVFGDGHIEFVTSFTPSGVFYERDGTRVPDNIFSVDDGPFGADVILSFTKSMTAEGPVLQHD